MQRRPCPHSMVSRCSPNPTSRRLSNRTWSGHSRLAKTAPHHHATPHASVSTSQAARDAGPRTSLPKTAGLVSLALESTGVSAFGSAGFSNTFSVASVVLASELKVGAVPSVAPKPWRRTRRP